MENSNKKFYLLSTGHYGGEIKEVESTTLEDFKNEIIFISKGFHNDFDSVIVVSADNNTEVKDNRIVIPEHTYIDEDGDEITIEEEPAEYEELTMNLLYTGGNCDNEDAYSWIDGKGFYDHHDYESVEEAEKAGELFADEDDILKHLTLQDVDGSIAGVFSSILEDKAVN